MEDTTQVSEALEPKNNEIAAELKEIAEVSNVAKKTNKRVDFDEKTLRRIEAMTPVYSIDLEGANVNEAFSYVLKRAVDSLFENEFKRKLEEI